MWKDLTYSLSLCHKHEKSGSHSSHLDQVVVIKGGVGHPVQSLFWIFVQIPITSWQQLINQILWQKKEGETRLRICGCRRAVTGPSHHCNWPECNDWTVHVLPCGHRCSQVSHKLHQQRPLSKSTTLKHVSQDAHTLLWINGLMHEFLTRLF